MDENRQDFLLMCQRSHLFLKDVSMVLFSSNFSKVVQSLFFLIKAILSQVAAAVI